MKRVKIFLASSAELDEDKEKFELFISNKNKDLYEKRIFLELSTWKDFISSIQEGRTQDEYNRYIRESDISIFLFHTKVGRYTREEFDNAHEAFLASIHKNKTPRIYTYFKNDKEETPEISNFRNYIDSLDHFYDTYNDLNELFVKFGHQLDKIPITPNLFDPQVILKYAVLYFLLPLLVLTGAFFSYYYFQPTSLTVKAFEVPSYTIKGLPMKDAQVVIKYGDKTEIKSYNEKDGFAPFTQIPSKYRGDSLKIHFEAKEFITIDTSIVLKRFDNTTIIISVKRDNSLSEIFGFVVDYENDMPISNACVSIGDIEAQTDNKGFFKIIIPFENQAEEQRIQVFKNGYIKYIRDIPVIHNVEVPIKLHKY